LFQCLPILATLKKVQGGDAQIQSGLNGTFAQSNSNISVT